VNLHMFQQVARVLEPHLTTLANMLLCQFLWHSSSNGLVYRFWWLFWDIK
jgi:hypothetical protein